MYKEVDIISHKKLTSRTSVKKILSRLVIVFLFSVLLTTFALIYNHTLFTQKLQTVRQEISIPTSEQNSYIGRIHFLSTAIQNSHYKILIDINDNQKESLEAEIRSMNELTDLRFVELQKLKSSIERNKAEGTPQKLLLQQLEAEIEVSDAKHLDLIDEIRLVQGKNIVYKAPTKPFAEWNYFYEQVIGTASVFVFHHKKEVEEARELTSIIKQNQLKWMYLILIVEAAILFLSMVVADFIILKSMEKIRCPPIN